MRTGNLRWWTSVCAVIVLMSSGTDAEADSTLDLSGEWRLQLDPEGVGLEQEWASRELPERIMLPGSLQEQGFGEDPGPDTPWTGTVKQEEWNKPHYAPYRTKDNFKMPFWLQPEKYYKGAAWYQREVEYPWAWQGKRIKLHLERPHWETRVWVDGREVGIGSGSACNSLSTPHEYDLTCALVPGAHHRKKHLLTIRVDNRVKINVGENAHSITDHTQSNWIRLHRICPLAQ